VCGDPNAVSLRLWVRRASSRPGLDALTWWFANRLIVGRTIGAQTRTGDMTAGYKDLPLRAPSAARRSTSARLWSGGRRAGGVATL
jgi:hypothetical protein